MYMQSMNLKLEHRISMLLIASVGISFNTI